MHQRYAQCRADRVEATALAHLLAPHSIARPKQAKEPIFTTLDRDVLLRLGTEN